MIGRRCAASLLAVALAVGSCSDRRSDEPVSTVGVVAVEFQFRPLTWTVAAGERLTVELVNRGTVGHDWTVIRSGREVRSSGSLTDGDVLGGTGPVAPGETRSMTFAVADRGTYQVICTVPGHFDAGMRAHLRVI